ncbi:GerAB/ArcD/ProY family transporter [Pseudalkalibacillus decolorationis]|uniref:GerAB/ArcD/ProY family transporter n=1 Tax=Pseudalkalibacillus decolorationis TaxID=163879 RepID=UPI002147F2E0|nr:spore germination protein [Pseudalkalibacillus decolorationis]
MNKEKINIGQLFTWVAMYQLGSAIIINLGMNAKQDAWLVILVAMVIGTLAFFLIYGSLFHLYPHLPLTGYTQIILGKYIGWSLGFMYLLYFIYASSRNLRDFGALILTSGYDETPLFVVHVIMIMTLVYGIRLGIEVYARAAQMFFMFFISLYIFGVILLIFSGVIDFKNLMPVLGNGWQPVVTTAFPLTYTFPFGEMIAFTMLLPYLNKSQSAVKVGVAGMIISGIILSLTVSLNISVLGLEAAERSIFPLIKTVGEINIGHLLQRMDAIALLIFVITSFFKIGTFFFVAVIAASDLFKVQKYGKLALPIGIIILFSSMIMASNFSEHLKEGLEIVPPYIHIPFQLGIPLLLLMVALFRKRFNRGH